MRVAKGGEPSPPSLTTRADQPAIAGEPALTPEVWSVLTPRQSEVVACIRLRAGTGRALNLTAVKREDPKLVAEVFSMQPYWGWRRAIEAAGLRYDRIPIYLEDTLECLVCGRRLRSLIGHLSARHELTPGAYQAEFPGAYCASETLRALRMSRPATLPHWEPIWSAEYVLDRVRYLHDTGINVNAESVYVSDPTLLDAGRVFWGTWDEALRASGLDPEAIRLASPGQPFPSPKEVTELILRRRCFGLPINSKAVKERDGRLMNAARRAFGTWAGALRAAGIKPSEVRLGTRHRADLPHRLLQRAREIAVMDDEKARRRALATLRRRYASFVYRHFGGWANLARVSGVPPERLMRRHASRERRFTGSC